MYSRITSFLLLLLRFAVVFTALLLSGVKVGYGQGATRTYLEGQKTGDYMPPPILIYLGPGSANISSPMQRHTSSLLNTFRFFYGPNSILTGSTTHFTRLTAAQDVGLLGALGAGANVYITFRNTNNTILSAGTTTYFKIGQRPTTEGISVAVGGLLGLVELQNISGRGYLGATNYSLSGNGSINEGSLSGTVNGTTTRFLIDDNGEWYIAITPDENYNSVRLEVKLPDDLRVADIARSVNVNVYNAFIESVGGACSIAGRYTSPGEATGITLNTGILGGIELNQLISNPHYALNNNPEQYASYSSGVLNLGVANTVSQTIYFDHTASGHDGVNVRLGLSNDLIGLDLLALNGITFSAYRGSSENAVWTGSLGDLANLLGLDLLHLISIGGNHSELNLIFKPGIEFDRIKIELNQGLLGIGVLGDALRVYNVTLAPSSPEITSGYQPTNTTVCESETASFTVTATVPEGTITGYQWQYFDGTDWVAAEGTNNKPTYVYPNTPTSFNGRRYRVRVTGGISGCEQTIYSNEATLTVTELPGKPHLTITDVNN